MRHTRPRFCCQFVPQAAAAPALLPLALPANPPLAPPPPPPPLSWKAVSTPPAIASSTPSSRSHEKRSVPEQTCPKQQQARGARPPVSELAPLARAAHPTHAAATSCTIRVHRSAWDCNCESLYEMTHVCGIGRLRGFVLPGSAVVVPTALVTTCMSCQLKGVGAGEGEGDLGGVHATNDSGALAAGGSVPTVRGLVTNRATYLPDVTARPCLDHHPKSSLGGSGAVQLKR